MSTSHKETKKTYTDKNDHTTTVYKSKSGPKDDRFINEEIRTENAPYADESTKADSIPSTAAISSIMKDVECHLHDAQRSVPPESQNGEQLLHDAELITADLRVLLDEKNRGDLVQRIMAEAELASKHTYKNGPGFSKPSKEQRKMIKDRSMNIGKAVKTLAVQSWTSPTFRRDIEEFFYVSSLMITGMTGLDVEKIAKPLHSVAQGDEPMSRQTLKKTGHKAKKTMKQANQEPGFRRRERKFTPEKQEEAIERLRLNLLSISQHPHSKEFVEGILDMISLFSEEINLKSHASGASSSVKDNDHLKEMLRLVRQLIERFVGSYTMSRLVSNFKKLVKIARKDPEVMDYFTQLRTFFITHLESPEKLETGNFNQDVKYLLDEGTRLSERRDMRRALNGMAKYSKRAVKNVANDAALTNLKTDLAQFVRDFAMDDRGRFSFNAESLRELRFLVAALVEKMVIQVPGFRQESDKVDLEVSHISVVLRDVIPDNIKLHYDGDMNLDSSNLTDLSMRDEFYTELNLENIQYHMTGINFWFHHKTFPKIEDTGNVDIDLGGKQGMNISIALGASISDGYRGLYEVKHVRCNIDKLNFKLHDTRHDFIYNTALKTQKGSIKKKIERAIEDKITSLLLQLNNLIADRAEQLRKEAPMRFAQMKKAGGEKFNQAKLKAKEARKAAKDKKARSKKQKARKERPVIMPADRKAEAAAVIEEDLMHKQHEGRRDTNFVSIQPESKRKAEKVIEKDLQQKQHEGQRDRDFVPIHPANKQQAEQAIERDLQHKMDKPTNDPTFIAIAPESKTKAKAVIEKDIQEKNQHRQDQMFYGASQPADRERARSDYA